MITDHKTVVIDGELELKSVIEGDIELSSVIDGELDKVIKIDKNFIHFGTTAYWNAQTSIISKEGHLYVYTDYETVDGVDIPAMKVGDGKAYLIDLPFLDGNQTALLNHIADTSVHITETERTFWNNKVTSYINFDDEENLVLTKENINA